MKTLIKFFQIFFIMLLPIISLANNGNDDIINIKAEEWTLYKAVDGVEIYYKSVECHQVQKGMHKEYVLLQFVNTTSQIKKIEWDNQIWIDGACVTCDGDEEHRGRVILKENETITGECDAVVDSRMRVFSRFLNYDDKPELSDLKIANIKVETK